MSNLEALRYAAQKIHRKAEEASKVPGSEAVWGLLEDMAESAAYLDQALLDLQANQPTATCGDKAPASCAEPVLCQARKDAERYRWLRDYHIGNDPESINLDRANRKGLNAAIDAAMRAQAGEGGEV